MNDGEMIDKRGGAIIYIHVTVDTDVVLGGAAPGAGATAEELDPRASQEETAALSCIPPGRAFMVVTGAEGVENQGTGDVTFNARVGEAVRFFAVSGSNNFDAAVLLLKILQVRGDAVLTGFQNALVERPGVIPGSPLSPLPAGIEELTFSFCQSSVEREGTGIYRLVLALYRRDDKGEPRFAGLYRWDPTITLSTTSTPRSTSTQEQEKTP